jgi:hypothetical protein
MAGESGVLWRSCSSDWPTQTVFSCPFLASRPAVSSPCSHACIPLIPPTPKFLPSISINLNTRASASGCGSLCHLKLEASPLAGNCPGCLLSKLRPIFPERSESVLAAWEARRTAWVCLKLHPHNSLASIHRSPRPLSATADGQPSRFRRARIPSLGPLEPLCRAPRSAHRWGSLCRRCKGRG